MSYDVVKPDFYRIHTPDTPWHAGAPGWSQAPWPGWGENPNLIGPRMLAVNGFGSEMSLHPTTPIPPGPVVQVTPTVAPPEKKIPWALIGLAALVAVGGYFMLKPADGRVVKSNGKMFRRNSKKLKKLNLDWEVARHETEWSGLYRPRRSRRPKRRPRRNHNLTVKGKRWVFPT